MRKLVWMILGLWLCGLAVVARADTYSLADGKSVSGDVVSFNDIGIIFRTADDTYSDRISWTKFSQDGLKQLAANPKIKPFVEPFIEIPESELSHKPEVKVQDVSRMELPPEQSLFGALFSSSVGLVVLLLIYAANIYAGFEVAIFRGRPKAVAMGVAAVLPVLGPVIFLSLPTHMEPAAPPVEETAAPAESEAHRFTMPGATLTPQQEETQIAAASWTAQPAAQIFQRGQFTFNRRFFETKFPGFFGVVRRGEDKDKVLTVKTLRGEFVVTRIARIGADTVHLQMVKGGASYEEMVPFTEIQEIQLA